jgi:dephospho-CoA kinase
MADKTVIGLTGNIATGKSLVMRMLQELGVTVIDADKLAHQLMRKGAPVYQAIVQEFGKFILDDNGEISRAKLGKIVFGDPAALAKLEALTHPGVRQEILRQVASAPTPVVAVEAIKLFESGLAEHCDATWVVVAPADLQLKRLVERRKMTPEQAKQRIKAQSPQQEKASKANVVIDNSGALAKTWVTVKKHFTDLVQSSGSTQSVAAEPEVATPTPQPGAARVEVDLKDLTIRRAKRGDLGGMSELIVASTQGTLSPDLSEMMESLFSRAYMVALAGGQVIGMIGWQAENLVAGLQDFYVLRDELWASVGQEMLGKVHDEVNSLSCEVSLVFVPNQAGPKPIEFLESQGYERSESKSLIPDWREAAVEWQPENSVLLYKKLREQRIMVPM